MANAQHSKLHSDAVEEQLPVHKFQSLQANEIQSDPRTNPAHSERERSATGRPRPSQSREAGKPPQRVSVSTPTLESRLVRSPIAAPRSPTRFAGGSSRADEVWRVTRFARRSMTCRNAALLLGVRVLYIESGGGRYPRC